MPHPPEGFVRSLEILDSLLSVRWSDLLGCWSIERKAHIPLSEIEFLVKRKARTQKLVDNPPADATQHVRQKNWDTYAGVAEELNAARSGKRVIYLTRELNDQVYNMLCASDIKRYGGYARFADEIESQESKRDAEAERAMANKTHALNLEAFDMLNFIWRKNETALLNGERNMGKLLHGKKSSGPLVQLTDF